MILLQTFATHRDCFHRCFDFRHFRHYRRQSHRTCRPNNHHSWPDHSFESIPWLVLPLSTLEYRQSPSCIPQLCLCIEQHGRSFVDTCLKKLSGFDIPLAANREKQSINIIRISTYCFSNWTNNFYIHWHIFKYNTAQNIFPQSFQSQICFDLSVINLKQELQ